MTPKWGFGLAMLPVAPCSSNTFGATVRARAAHETVRRFCRSCDRMFRSAANRARHERLCPDQPQAVVVDVGP